MDINKLDQEFSNLVNRDDTSMELGSAISTMAFILTETLGEMAEKILMLERKIKGIERKLQEVETKMTVSYTARLPAGRYTFENGTLKHLGDIE